MDITTEDNIFVYKLSDKSQVSFLYCMYAFSVEQYSIIQFLRMARYTLRLTDFALKASQLYTRIPTQGEDKATILRQMNKKHAKDTLKYFPSIIRDITK